MSDNFDPIIVQIGVDWLTQYARFLRKSPESLHRLRERTDEFELVPVPRQLLDRLAVPGLIGSGDLGGGADGALDDLLQIGRPSPPSDARLPFAAGHALPSTTTPAVSSPSPPLGRIRELAHALEAGDLAAIRTLLSPTFIDRDGRGAAEILAALKSLIEHTSTRRLLVLELRETRRSPTEVEGHVEAVWDAAQLSDSMPLTERVTLAVCLQLDREGAWRISDLRTL